MKKICRCPECEKGELQAVVKDYEVVNSGGECLTVPDIEIHQCNSCGMVFIPAASSRRISEFQAQANDQLTPRELYEILVRSGKSQKDFAAILGLGEKTLCRWLKGTQAISRSMGYYLRVMDQMPDAFKWVQCKKWKKVDSMNHKKVPKSLVFPALDRRRQMRKTPVVSGNPSKKFTETATLYCRTET